MIGWPRTSDLVGYKLAHLRIDAKLGEGGMGVVYRATDEKLRREVALKVLPEEVGDNDDRRRRFLRAARSAAAATHPCIATVHEIGEADGYAFIAMELVRGTTVRDLLAQGLRSASGAGPGERPRRRIIAPRDTQEPFRRRASSPPDPAPGST
jgi:serine/threonine-protein kinase